VMGIFIYYILMHSVYFGLIVLGFIEQRRYHDGILIGDFRRIEESGLSLPVSVVISAFNEEKMIVSTVLSVMQLKYSEFEVIVVNDGSIDDTLATLIKHFDMFAVEVIYKKTLQIKPVHAVYRSRTYPNLLVIDKENGRRADANNAGVEHARYPIICQIDADCVLEPDALLRMVRPFLNDRNVVAVTGMIRPANGLLIDKGKIVEHGLPRNFLPLMQYVEYLRSFQWARSGLTRLGSNLCMSGAYTVIRKDIFLKVGGANVNAVVDDFELTVTVQRYIHEHPEEGPLKLVFVPDPGCYTEVPETWKALYSQRNFWQRAILQSMIWNRDMALNARYGMVGFFAYPFFFLFEALSAVVELLAYLSMPIGLYLGLTTSTELLLFFVFSVGLGAFVSICAVLLQQRTRMRQNKTREIIRLLYAGVLEHFGYHQFHVLSRIAGIYDLLIRKRLVYGYRVRSGYLAPKD
jgi:cellulose synthase/poly-beta-1,6-N-acetylglucosamine synthase-like glycosyltransferase